MGNTLSQAERDELEQLRAFKASQAATGNIRLKVSAKGAVSLYGLGRFPVTLYAEQWEKVVAIAPQITEFVKTNAASLAFKNRQPV